MIPLDEADKIDFVRVSNTFESWWKTVGETWSLHAILFAVPLVLAGIWYLFRLHKRGPFRFFSPNGAFPLIISIVAMGVGTYLAWTKAFLCDDAYISLRYAQNLVEGNGLVFNVGERVEGITNFLWTVAVALLSLVLPLEMTFIAVAFAMVCLALNFFAVYRIGRRLQLDSGSSFFLPIAVSMMSVQFILTNYGTSGLETSAASLLVSLGLLFLVSPPSPKHSLLSGLMFILATLTRPDHAVFFVAGGCAEAVRAVGLFVKEKRDAGRFRFRLSQLKHGLLFSAPFLLYLAFLVWRFLYYGDWVPNTYYTKSVELSYFAQGFLYVELFYLQNHFYIPLLLFLAWLLTPTASESVRRMKVFALFSTVVYHYYILKIGGCFMNGRFFVSLIPMIFLAVESWVHLLLNAKRAPRLLAATAVLSISLLSASAIQTVFLRVDNSYGFIFDEYHPCRISGWFPLKVIHFSHPMGKRLRELITDRGLKPTISTHGIGMIAYYSELETIDQLGLTDSYVAKLPIEHRGASGHEKHAPFEYLQERGVIFGRVQTGAPPQLSRLPKIDWGPKLDEGWNIVIYKKEWIDKFRKLSPEMRFMDLLYFLDNSYLPNAAKTPSERLLSEVSWLEKYYFFHNDDPVRYGKLLDLLENFTMPECVPDEAPVCDIADGSTAD